jgi:hypothetical protein
MAITGLATRRSRHITDIGIIGIAGGVMAVASAADNPAVIATGIGALGLLR